MYYSTLIVSVRSYGKLGENPFKYTKTVLGDDEKLKKLSVSPFFQHENFMQMENDESELIEIIMTPKTVYDDKPVSMAAAILSNSKLHFMRFIYLVVFKFFRPGSFKLVYCDTDSIAIGKYNSILLHIKTKLPKYNTVVTSKLQNPKLHQVPKSHQFF